MPTWEVTAISRLTLADLQQWVQAALREPSDERNQFNWLGLAYTLAFDARQRTEVAEKIRLAEIAVTIYEWLDQYRNPEQSGSYTDSALALRLHLLTHQYVASSHPVLGTRNIKRPWERTGLSPAAARRVSLHLKHKLSEGVRQVSLEEKEQLKILRQIKNKLLLIRQLPPDDELFKESEKWLKVLSDLP
jgi:hypothetical protein